MEVGNEDTQGNTVEDNFLLSALHLPAGLALPIVACEPLSDLQSHTIFNSDMVSSSAPNNGGLSY